MSSPEFFRTIDFFPVIDRSKCTLCMGCAEHCGLGVIEAVRDERTREVTFRVLRHRCRNCRTCVKVCRRGAVSITAEMGGRDAGHLKKDLL